MTDPQTGASLEFVGDPVRVTASPRFLDAAVSYAIDESANHMGLLEVISTPSGARVYRLTTADDQPAWLRAVAADGGAGGGSLDMADAEARPIELYAKVGRFGSAARELRLLRTVRDRLRTLQARHGG
jgi:hypothetical protein